jgi:hypothetical protein
MFQGCFWVENENRDSQQGWFPSFDFQRAKIQEICEKKEDL